MRALSPLLLGISLILSSSAPFWREVCATHIVGNSELDSTALRLTQRTRAASAVLYAPTGPGRHVGVFAGGRFADAVKVGDELDPGGVLLDAGTLGPVIPFNFSTVGAVEAAGREYLAGGSARDKKVAVFCGGKGLNDTPVRRCDFVSINVIVGALQHTTVATDDGLSAGKWWLAAAGSTVRELDTVAFAGGRNGTASFSDVDFVNVTSRATAYGVTQLSVERFALAGAAVANSAGVQFSVFAGGMMGVPPGTASDAVDVVVNPTGDLGPTGVVLSAARTLLVGAGAGAIAVFAGGFSSSPVSTVDIFNADNNFRRTTRSLQTPRIGHAMASLGRYVFIGGGTDTLFGPALGSIETLDTCTGFWQDVTALCSESKQLAAVGAGNFVFFEGGTSSLGTHKNTALQCTASCSSSCPSAATTGAMPTTGVLATTGVLTTASVTTGTVTIGSLTTGSVTTGSVATSVATSGSLTSGSTSGLTTTDDATSSNPSATNSNGPSSVDTTSSSDAGSTGIVFAIIGAVAAAVLVAGAIAGLIWVRGRTNHDVSSVSMSENVRETPMGSDYHNVDAVEAPSEEPKSTGAYHNLPAEERKSSGAYHNLPS
jgi:hypothetical protein